MVMKTVSVTIQENPESSDLTIHQEKIHYRRKRINELRMRGCTNKEISDKLGYSLSTVEKDLKGLRDSMKSWYEEESVIDYCQSIHESVTMYELMLAELKEMYSKADNDKERLEIMTKIGEFQERIAKLYQETAAVQKYITEVKCQVKTK